MAIPPLILKIVADSSGVKAGVAETNAQVSGLKSSVSANAMLIKGALIGGVVAGLAAAAKAASDLGESQNKANVIFGDSVGLVNNFADEAAQGFGISKAAALESAASFGAMFDSAGLAEEQAADMSVTMTGLAGDMASFNNEDPSDMLERLRSGLAGEAEPLRRFGVFISEARVQTEAYRSGIAEVGTELTDAQKIQARFNIVMQDTAKQQGDFGRTLGESLPNQIRVLKAELTDTAAAVGAHLLPALLEVAKAANALLQQAQPLIDFFGRALPGAIQSVLAPLGTFTDAVETIKRILPGVQEGEEQVSFWQGLGKSIGDLGADILRVIPGGKGLADVVGMLGEKTGDAAGETDVFVSGIRAMRGGINDALGPLDVLAQQHAAAADAARDQRAAELSLAGGLLGLVGDLETVNDAQKEVNKLRRQGKTDTAEYRDAVLALATSSVSFEGNLRDYISSQKDANASTRDTVRGLVDLGKEFGFTRGDLENILGPLGEYVRGLKDVPGKVETDVALHTDAARHALANFIAGASGTQIDAYLNFHIPNYPGRQHGGPVTSMRPYIVGERGPEVFVPSSSGSIVANAGGGGGDVVLQIHGQTFARITRDELLKLKGSRVSLGLS